VSIEKFGTDPGSLPPTDGQVDEIKKLASDLGVGLSALEKCKTQEDANKLIDKLKKEGDTK
jgi:hypothetical protein